MGASNMILPKLNGTPGEYRKMKAMQLRALYIVYLVASFVGAFYELFNQIKMEDRPCDEYFPNSLWGNTVIYIVLRMLDYLFPVWTVIWVFWNWRKGLPTGVGGKTPPMTSTDKSSSTSVGVTGKRVVHDTDGELELSVEEDTDRDTAPLL